MTDDNVLKFTGKNHLTFVAPGRKTVLVIRPDGVKLRGSDRLPLAALDRHELLKVIDELCDLIARR